MNTTLPLTVSDYVVVLGYFLLVLGIGLWFRKRLTTMGGYFAGDHQIPWWMAGISHYMSSFSAFSFIAYAQIAYLYGWVAVTLFWVSIPGCVLGGLLFAKRWRRARVLTPIEFLEGRYNASLRQIFAWAGIPMKIFDDALKVFATGVFVSLATGLSIVWSIVLCGVVMVLYTYFGGLWALVVTDYIQFLMKGLAITLMCPLAVHAAGGLKSGLSRLPSGFLMPVHAPYGWLYVAGFGCVMVVSYNASWSLAQKYYSVPDEKAASKAAYLSAALNFVGAPLMILPAILGRHFLPDLVAAGRTADTYVLLVTKLLPEGMVGIILAAMFSATMAAVSADFNSIAGVLTQDVFHRLISRSASEDRLLAVGRWTTALLGTLTTLLSLWIAHSHSESLFGLMVTVLGVFIVPTLLPLLLGLTTRWITARGAAAGFVCGLVSGIVLLFLKLKWPPAKTLFGNLNAFEGFSLLANTAATLLGSVLASFRPRSAQEEARVTVFWKKIETPVHAPSAGVTSGDNNSGVLAVSTLAVAVLIALAGVLARSRLAMTTDLIVALGLCLVAAALYKRQVRL